MVYIYTLKLEDNKYYIGKTNNPDFRLNNHFNLNGSEWTKKYKPIEVIEIKNNCDDYDEDKITLQYMDKYGINNVRGGSFVSLKLDKSVINTLHTMINGTNDKCFICSEKGHFAKNCDKSECLIMDSNDEGYSSSSSYSSYSSYSSSYSSSSYIEEWYCEYCGKEFDTKKGATYHQNIYCKKKYNTSSYNNCCFRCGRKGHYSSSCYASKHIKGYYLK